LPSSLEASDSAPAPSSASASELLATTGRSSLSKTGGVATEAAALPDRFRVAFLAVPLLVIFFAAFVVVFFAAFLVAFLAAPFLVDFFAAFLAPPRDLDFDALFFAALPPPLRAPLDFLLPFLVAMGSLLYLF
jgi:hypothetical protein